MHRVDELKQMKRFLTMETIKKKVSGEPPVQEEKKQVFEDENYHMKQRIQPNEILRRIKIEKFKQFGKFWHEHEEGLNCENFIMNISRYCEYEPEERILIMNGAIQLFQELDIHGTGLLQWDDFVAFSSNKVDCQDKVRPYNGTGSTSHMYLIEQNKKSKMTQFHKFKHQEYINDKGKHKSCVMQVLYNIGPSWISTMNPVIMYASEKTSFLCWLNAASLDIQFQDYVPVLSSGSFVKSIGYENFDKDNSLCHQIQAHTLYAVSCTDNQIHFYQQQSDRIRYFRSFDIGNVTIQKLWYLPLHELWLCGCKDLMTRSFRIEKKSELKLEKPIKLHYDELMEVIELASPLKCIVTCGLDKQVIMYSLLRNELIRVLPGHHNTSVRKMEYFPDWGNLLLTIGREQDVFVWAMDNTIADPIYGRMKGHKQPTTDSARFPKQPFAATIDMCGTVKVWDVRLLCCLQTVVHEIKAGAEGWMKLLMISRDRFMTAGLRLKIFQVSGAVQAKNNIMQRVPMDLQKKRQMKQPKYVVFNKHYSMLVVVTSRDIKMYRLRDGFMQTLVTDIFEEGSTIQSFKMDSRERRCYVSSSKGDTKVINVMDGVVLKTLVQRTTQRKHHGESGSDKDDSEREKGDQTLEGEEASSSSTESEEKKPVRSTLTRRASFVKPHQDDQMDEMPDFTSVKAPTMAQRLTVRGVTADVFRMVRMEYAHKMSVLIYNMPANKFQKTKEVAKEDETGRFRPVRASYDLNEIILIGGENENFQQLLACDKDAFFVLDDSNKGGNPLDFRTEKLETAELMRICTGAHSDDICCLGFSYELSLVATGGSCGQIAVYDFERSKLLDFCVAHDQEITSINFLWPYPAMVTTSLDCQICLWRVRAVGTDTPFVTLLYRFLNVSYSLQQMDLVAAPVHSSYVRQGVNLKGIQREKKEQTNKQLNLGASAYREFKANVVLSQMEAFITINDQGKFRGPSESEKLRQRLIANYKELDVETGRNKIDSIFDKQNALSNHNKKDWFGTIKKRLLDQRLIDVDYDKDLDVAKERIFFYFGDELGYIKLWDLTWMVQQSMSKCTKTHAEWKGTKYFPYRIEGVEIHHLVSKAKFKQARRRAKQNPEMMDPLMTCVQLRDCKAHKDSVTNLSVWDGGGFLASISTDYQVRIWSGGFDLWGQINQLTEKVDPKWYFPQDVLQREREKDIAHSSTVLCRLSKIDKTGAGADFEVKEDDKLLLELQEMQPQINDENLLDKTNSSMDSIEKRLQESLLGTRFDAESDEERLNTKKVGTLKDEFFYKNHSFKKLVLPEEKQEYQREKCHRLTVKKHQTGMKARIKELTRKIVLIAFSSKQTSSIRKSILKDSFCNELGTIQSELERMKANEALKKRQSRLEDEELIIKKDMRESHSQPLFITEMQLKLDDCDEENKKRVGMQKVKFGRLNRQPSAAVLRRPPSQLHKCCANMAAKRKTCANIPVNRDDLQMKQEEVKSFHQPIRVLTSQGDRKTQTMCDEQGSGVVATSTREKKIRFNMTEDRINVPKQQQQGTVTATNSALINMSGTNSLRPQTAVPVCNLTSVTAGSTQEAPAVGQSEDSTFRKSLNIIVPSSQLPNSNSTNRLASAPGRRIRHSTSQPELKRMSSNTSNIQMKLAEKKQVAFQNRQKLKSSVNLYNNDYLTKMKEGMLESTWIKEQRQNYSSPNRMVGRHSSILPMQLNQLKRQATVRAMGTNKMISLVASSMQQRVIQDDTPYSANSAALLQQMRKHRENPRVSSIDSSRWRSKNSCH